MKKSNKEITKKNTIEISIKYCIHEKENLKKEHLDKSYLLDAGCSVFVLCEACYHKYETNKFLEIHCMDGIEFYE